MYAVSQSSWSLSRYFSPWSKAAKVVIIITAIYAYLKTIWKKLET